MTIPQDKFLDLVHLTWYTFNSQFYKKIVIRGLALSTTAEIYMQAHD